MATTIQEKETALKKAAREAAKKGTLRGSGTMKERMNAFTYGILAKRFGIKKRHGHLHNPGKAT